MFGTFEVCLVMTSTPMYFLKVFEAVCNIKTYKK